MALAAGCAFAAPALSQLDAALLDLVLLGAFSTAIPYGCQAAALKLVTPAHASLIVSLEGLSGVMGAFVLLGERPTLLVLTGAALLLFAIAYAASKTEGIRGAQ